MSGLNNPIGDLYVPVIVTHCCKYCYSIYVYRSGTSLCLAMLGRSSSPSAAWLRWITRADCCFSSSVQFTADAQASSQFSSSSGLCQRAHSGFCRPNFAAFDCFEQRSLPGSRAACVGVSHADVPAVFLYLYCFSQPFSFACKKLLCYKAAFLIGFAAQVFFLRFALLFAVGIQRAHGQHNMGGRLRYYTPHSRNSGSEVCPKKVNPSI